MEKTWKSTVAGILDIVAGALSLVGLILVIVGTLTFMATGGTDLLPPMPFPMPMGMTLIFVIAVPVLILAVLAIIGGVYALKRKKWGWALTGSIVTFFITWPLGIAAIVLTIMSKNEFE